MTTATIRVQQAGGTHFLLEHLYKIARSEKKEARRLFNNDFASDSLSPATTMDTATMMSSIMDSNGYTTMSRHGGSPTASPPLKLCPQSRSPLHQGFGSGTRRNPFDDKFLKTFPPMFVNDPANKNAPADRTAFNVVVAAVTKKPSPDFAGMKTKLGDVTVLFAEGKQTYEEPALRVSAADFFPALSAKELSYSAMADGPANKTAPAEVVAAALNKPTPGLALMKMKLGSVPTSTALFADGEKNHEDPALHISAAILFSALSAKDLGDSAAVQTANFGVGIGLVPPLGADGTGVDDVAMDLGAKNVLNKSLSPSFVSPYGIELDLDAYVNGPASCQPTKKKALCEDQMLLVTAAQSTSTSTSPARVSLYSNKRTAISSPAKGGMAPPKLIPPSHGNDQPVFPLQKSQVPPSINQKKAFNASLGMQKLQRDANNAAQRTQMGPFDKLVATEEKADTAKEDTCLLGIKLLREKFEHAAHQKVDGLLMDTSHSEDDTDAPDFGDDGIYGKDYDNEDEDFSYHLLDGSAEEEIDDHGELGADAVGTSPLVTSAGGKTGKVDDLLDWLQEITLN
jgi:hypothetical protein